MEEPQSGRNESFRKIEEAVLEKYTVEVSKRAHRRGEPSEWRMFREPKNINLESGKKSVVRESFRGSGSYDLQRKKGVKESQTEKKDMRQQQKGEGHDRYDKKNLIRRQSGRKQQLVGQ